LSLQIGEQTATHSLQQLSQDQLFLSLDTSGFPAGCSLQAIIDNDGRGRSQPFTLAQMIRLPQIESFDAAGAQAADGTRAYTLTGYNLEMIGKAGWDSETGTDVADLPAPVPGEGLKQILQISLPDPPKSQAPLFIWLRGETNGRATKILAPALPAGTRPAAAPVLPKSLPMPDSLPPVVPAPMPAPPNVTLPAAEFAPPENAVQVPPPYRER
jgi:hypothetical protein